MMSLGMFLGPMFLEAILLLVALVLASVALGWVLRGHFGRD